MSTNTSYTVQVRAHRDGFRGVATFGGVEFATVFGFDEAVVSEELVAIATEDIMRRKLNLVGYSLSDFIAVQPKE
jgi:hypothetical protein